MKNVDEIIELLKAAKPDLARRFGVRRLAVFGSYARGDQREDSDVDILVEVDPSIGWRFVDLAEEIEAMLGVRTELVSRRAIKPRNWNIIERELIDVP
ncbi:MAG: nucleotidyltransferase family protein [bacterium]